jgi:hypothetical protein
MQLTPPMKRPNFPALPAVLGLPLASAPATTNAANVITTPGRFRIGGTVTPPALPKFLSVTRTGRAFFRCALP